MGEQMKKYVFMGAYDKTDMLIYAAKILTLMGKKVILIDTTLLKKSRYIVPTMVQEKQYITTYEDIDVAIGFESLDAIKQYKQKILGQAMQYDIALLDIDRGIAYQKFGISSEDRHFFVTSFDIYNLKRGVQILAQVQPGVKVTKIYYTKSMSSEEDQYLNYLSKNYKIKWDEKDVIFFPFETSDLNAIYINQRSEKIQTKGLSNVYIDSLLYLVEQIAEEGNGKVKKAYKMMES